MYSYGYQSAYNYGGQPGGCCYPYPVQQPCCGYGGGYGGGYGATGAIVLVLFILLVIVIGSRLTNV